MDVMKKLVDELMGKIAMALVSTAAGTQTQTPDTSLPVITCWGICMSIPKIWGIFRKCPYR